MEGNIMSNKEFIKIVENAELLKIPSYSNVKFKKRLLMRLGFKELLENGSRVKIGDKVVDTGSRIRLDYASPLTIFLHVKGAYYCALREEGLL